ncbi:hypothetical protein R1CP_37130 (plasmid) [Rhodococcus opacus]|uniref:Uncharacterized protein n=1 Tax=Rhodococcus opacus TaxID=37919 RepID=A0A1B1KHD9_RHOOP|nr:hypothetical protein R1CP_37130 [Rhodococcus opacus]
MTGTYDLSSAATPRVTTVVCAHGMQRVRTSRLSADDSDASSRRSSVKSSPDRPYERSAMRLARHSPCAVMIRCGVPARMLIIVPWTSGGGNRLEESRDEQQVSSVVRVAAAAFAQSAPNVISPVEHRFGRSVFAPVWRGGPAGARPQHCIPDSCVAGAPAGNCRGIQVLGPFTGCEPPFRRSFEKVPFATSGLGGLPTMVRK